MKKNKIFISIASYRDPELIPTIEDCLAQAKNPRNLVFGISRQFHSDDKFDDLSKYKKRKNFKIIETPHEKSLGVCHARHNIQKLYDDEEYYFQLDSHHRFIKDWDVKIKDCLNKLKSNGHTKPLLSSYLPSYDPDQKGEARLDDVWRTYIDRFMPEGPIFIFPETIPGWKDTDQPQNARFISGHFIFSDGSFVNEVPYDPELYFHGEESSLAARAYTHGYDLFHLPKPWVWHHYTREGYKRHWDDSSKWQTLNNHSFSRYRKLFGMGTKKVNYKKYGFGKVRTLKDYEIYSGLKFSTRQIHQSTIDRIPPPVPFKNKKDYESHYVSQFKYCIDIHKPTFTEDDYDVWVMAFKDKDGNEMIRLDANQDEVNHLLNENPKDNFVRMWRQFETHQNPTKWIVWPHSKSKGWMTIIEGEIPN
jgi:GT2 family glycosyltransferase